MIEKFKELDPNDFKDNVIRLIGKEWMLITAGTLTDVNTMTAAWGGLGYLWNLPVAFIFIRPQRYTFEFTEMYLTFALSFFEKKHREILTYCGNHSGREFNKIKETGLSAFQSPSGNVLFKEAKLNIECTKIYSDDIKESKFILPEIDHRVYPDKDYHRFYIGKIDHLWLAKK
ncbi:MAG: flavin reductase [Bacteroidetes bacterium HGW-Bacteroidetes-17]|nr:MAG: flavin reductase [Bacteroidetes bacterium HGW-Bacteroidetes-17]